MIPKYSLLLTLAVLLSPANLLAATDGGTQPRLVLQLTIDGLRADLLSRYLVHFGDDGFRYLTGEGLWYTNAHYQHANTETIVGHSTLATGAQPADHGMIGNLWFDRASGELAYNIEDPTVSLVGDSGGVDRKNEIDPTQKAARSDGRSPRNILTSTFSDELALATVDQAKIYGVSVKDRGAVPLAGHNGKAFWFSKKAGGFVSSTYYYDNYPDWVNDWNGRKLADRYAKTSWELAMDPAKYQLKDRDDRKYEIDLKGYGRTFPHPFGSDPRYLYTLLTLSPVGDKLTLDFAKTLIEKEQLGEDQITDYLAISFSSTDYVNHIFGPSSLEMEDNLIQLDRTLAELFHYIDGKIGLDNCLIVLSADHGSPEAPEQMEELGLDAMRLSPERVETDAVMEALKKRFSLAGELISTYYHPYIYLNRELIREKGLDQAEVEAVIVQELTKIPGISHAVSSMALKKHGYVNPQIDERVRNNFNPARSGDIYVIQQSYDHLVSDEKTPLAAMHGSPYQYDGFVPVIFAGYSIPHRKINREIHPTSIAPTLSNVLGIKPPSAAWGEVLTEVAGD